MNLRSIKLSFWPIVLLIIWALGLYATFHRFYYGLGATTNLSDQFPWGIWIGFDILVGVGLAAGGFVICAAVYIFNLKDFKPILRPTILTAFLGYLLVIGALLFDLGKPWNIWHPIILWNPHSVMFEVGWCVMLYTTVLFLEFLPLLFERFRLDKPLRLLRSITIPIVIIGVLLSTLHQSSLGTLYVITPDKLHPLWYSGLLPLFFFISAIGGGLAMVIFESYLSARAFKKQLEFSLLVRLSRVIVVVLGVWLVLRIQDLSAQKALPYILDGSRESIFFLLEAGLGMVLPMILFLIPRIRNSMGGLYLGAILVLIGFVMSRLNVAITGMSAAAGVEYVPSWMEVAVTASIVAAGFVIFRLASKYLPVFSSDIEVSHTPPLIAAGRSGSIAMGVLGVLLILIFIGIGSGFFNRDLTAKPMETSTEIAAQHPALHLPQPILFEMGETSPGQVTFDHESHVDPEEPNCRNCHLQLFSIRPEKAGKKAATDSGGPSEHQKCGSCHDGEKAFNWEENCEGCHVAGE